MKSLIIQVRLTPDEARILDGIRQFRDRNPLNRSECLRMLIHREHCRRLKRKDTPPYGRDRAGVCVGYAGGEAEGKAGRGMKAWQRRTGEKMKINIEVKNCRTGHTWWEDYEFEGTDPQAKAQEVINIWNDGLRPHEDRREVLQVQILDDRPDSSTHKWEKTNAGTRMGRGHMVYDTYRCAVCRITGRRYGLNGSIQPDKQFGAKKYLDCRNAKKILNERAKALG